MDSNNLPKAIVSIIYNQLCQQIIANIKMRGHENLDPAIRDHGGKIYANLWDGEGGEVEIELSWSPKNVVDAVLNPDSGGKSGFERVSAHLASEIIEKYQGQSGVSGHEDVVKINEHVSLIFHQFSGVLEIDVKGKRSVLENVEKEKLLKHLAGSLTLG